MTQADWFSSLVLRFLALSARAFGLQHRLVTELSADDTEKMSVALPSSADVARLIQKRRSIFPKDYVKGAVVTEEDITTLLQSADWAPTHGKTEPWRFIVLASHSSRLEFYGLVETVMQEVLEGEELQRRKAKLEALIAKKEPSLSHLIVISCRRAPNSKGIMMPEWEDMAAVACAVQNLHLQATAMGIAGYWSSFPADAVRSSPAFKAGIGLQAEDICMGVFFLGRSNAIDSYRSKREALETKVTWRG